MSDTRPDDDQRPAGDEEPDSYQPDDESASKNKKTAGKLVLFIIGMFIFAAAMIPLYNLVCAKLDPGGSSWQNGEVSEYDDVEVDESRTLEIRFASEVNKRLPWEFEPIDKRVEIHPGEKKLVKFRAKNLDPSNAITGQAVYDINPPEAGPHFKKIECFCFKEQTLEPGEEVEMPVYLWFEPDVPEDVKQITIAYTFFNAESSRERQIHGSRTGTSK